MTKHAGRIWIIVAILTATMALAGGAQEAPARADTAQPRAASGWEVFPLASSAKINTIDMVDSTDGWSGGYAGFMFHYNGTQWQQIATSFDYWVNAIDMVSSSQGWGVTHQGWMLYYNGTSWERHGGGPAATSYLKDIHMLSPTEGWTVGGPAANGQSTILRYSAAGNQWQQVATPTSVTLNGVDMLNVNEGWAVGVSATFLRWNGSTWLGGSTAGGIVLNDVDMVSSNDGWAVGTGPNGGVMYHWDGITWAAVAPPTTQGLSAVQMLSATEGWAVGEGGVILSYDGTGWQAVSSPTTENLTDLHFVSPTDGWAVGWNGAILRYTGSPDLSTSTKSVSARQAIVGQELTYTLAVRNTGNVSATGLVVTDNLPLNATYVVGSASPLPDSGPDPLVWTVGNLDPGAEETLSFRVIVQDAGLPCFFVVNNALVAGDNTGVTLRAVSSVGACQRTHLPLIRRGP